MNEHGQAQKKIHAPWRGIATLSAKEIYMFKTRIHLLASILTTAFICLPLAAHAAPPPPNPYQTSNTNYGVSGGNINDITHAFCCSGTLGSLVTAGGVQYILSNNHILARQDQASPGEDISQPGLVDSSCSPATIVADFTKAVPLRTPFNNVDCAIAELRSGQMNLTGFIEGLNGTGGQPSTMIAAPSVGMAVQKSGRTTGHTTGTIGSINTSVNVQYQLNCHSGKKYILTYTNQVVINSSSFSAGGDSGSLILTNTSCAHPVALLFAGSSSTTIGNPISDVLNALAGVGYAVSFVGQTCTGSSSPQAAAQSFQLPQQAVDRASRVLEENRHDLMSRPGVLGVGLGALEDNSQAAVIVYVDKTSSAKPQLPGRVDNVPVRVIFTDPFIAF
jgi:hypothetical protein